ncbi:MAG: putative dsRNA-binding protein [Deltaproteobacteria bacterium]|nr:putative dsRNA-binding protein [Deltaproteobacteria bacterium]MCX7953355.1 putative dsRNA-binding protein [Deltaproteobacteria bacterium]
MVQDETFQKLVSNLEKKLDYVFLNRELLIQALTHPVTNPSRNFEPLEFLGDSVLNCCVAFLVFNKVQTSDEGILTRYKGYLVSKGFLERIVQDIGLFELVSWANRDYDKITQKTLCDVFEAIIGACFLDSSFETVYQLIKKFYTQRFPSYAEILEANPKSVLQEWCQQKGIGLPVYEVVSQEGPVHNTTFIVNLRLPTGEEFEGKGPSKSVAEKNAAFEAIKFLDLNLYKPSTSSS